MKEPTSETRLENGDQAGNPSDDAKGPVLEGGGVKSSEGGHATEDLRPMRERFQDTLVGLQTRAKDVGRAIRRQAVRADENIRAKPYHAMGIAAGAGMIAGYLIARRRSSS